MFKEELKYILCGQKQYHLVTLVVMFHEFPFVSYHKCPRKLLIEWAKANPILSGKFSCISYQHYSKMQLD